MKKILIGASLALGLGALVLAAVAFLRPDLTPKLGVASTKDDYGLYCKEHGVPEKFCTLCHPELKEKLLLCPEHGNIPEDVCTKCHPENAEKYDIKPCEHGLPAHFCTTCHPENFKEGDSASAGPNLIDDGWCKQFGEKGADGKPKFCTFLPMVRLASTELAGEVGLSTAPVIEEEHTHELSANAETAYNANRYAEIHPRVAGFLREATPDLGRSMKAGDRVVTVSTAKAQYITSRSAYELAKDVFGRTGVLAASKVIADAKLVADRSAMNQAEATLLDAEQRLRNFRFDDAGLVRILREKDTRPLLDVTTPLGGTVVFRHAVLGEAVEPTTKLYTVADVSTMWLWIHVFERDVPKVAPGQKVAFAVLSSGPDETPDVFDGEVTWVGTEVDETTRTTRVRAELPNPGGKLRANQFGKARIRVEEPHKALVVSKGAVQRHEGVDVVFLKQSESTYRPQRIKSTAMDRKDALEVVWGLKAGESVVTDGSFLLKTEIMKGSIGAGCCD